MIIWVRGRRGGRMLPGLWLNGDTADVTTSSAPGESDTRHSFTPPGRDKI